jgi:NAD dependent epimerase/dehydratase family enzyme
MKVAVTGSSGLIGTALAASLRADGHQVVRLVRRAPRTGLESTGTEGTGPEGTGSEGTGSEGTGPESTGGDAATSEVRWDPRAADAGAPALSGVDAVVHLAGAGVGDHRWTARYKAEIRASRVLSTSALAAAVAAAQPRPKAFVVASAIGWYGDTGGREVTEAASAGQGFLARVVHDWEAAADPAREAGVRVVHLRSGLVLGAGGGFLGRLAPPARFGVLPRFGDGSQVMSWISLTDEVRAIRFLLDGAGTGPDGAGPADPRRHGAGPDGTGLDGKGERSGSYNLTAPNPVTNAQLTAALHAAFQRPDFPWLRVPAFLLKLGLGEMSAELLTSARVLPARLEEAGFAFKHPTIAAALAAELPR